MASDLTKFLNKTLYEGRECAALRRLGIRVVGHAPLSTTGPTGDPRIANLAVVDFHPWPSRRRDTEHRGRDQEHSGVVESELE